MQVPRVRARVPEECRGGYGRDSTPPRMYCTTHIRTYSVWTGGDRGTRAICDERERPAPNETKFDSSECHGRSSHGHGRFEELASEADLETATWDPSCGKAIG